MGYKLVIKAEQAIADAYYALIPKYKNVQRQMYPAHVSAIRRQPTVDLKHWGKYQDELVIFYYSDNIRFGTVYYWLDVFSQRLDEIRIELGLSVEEHFTPPPEGFKKCYHLTLGNIKPPFTVVESDGTITRPKRSL